MVDPAGEPAPGVPSVGATNWNGGLTATRHLLGLGHRRVGMIAGPAKMLCSRAREDGYRKMDAYSPLPIEELTWRPDRIE